MHVEQLQEDWAARGIRFERQTGASLISVVFHDMWEDENKLFIGHAGVLFPVGETLYFIEKLAFQEPYQLTKFQDRTELNAYLMTKYNVDENQPTAVPFIIENDSLMEGYCCI